MSKNLEHKLNKREGTSLTSSQTDKKQITNLTYDRVSHIKQIYSTDTKDTIYVRNLYEYCIYYIERLIPLSIVPIEIMLNIFVKSHPEWIQDRYEDMYFKQDRTPISIREADRYFIYEIELEDPRIKNYPYENDTDTYIAMMNVYVPFETENIRVDWGDGTQSEKKDFHTYYIEELTTSEIRDIIKSDHPEWDEKKRERMLNDTEYTISLNRRPRKYIVTIEFLDIPNDDYQVEWYNVHRTDYYKQHYDYSDPYMYDLWTRCITHIHMWGKHITLPDGGEQFRSMEKLVWMTHLLFPDISHITDMSYMFYDSSKFKRSSLPKVMYILLHELNTTIPDLLNKIRSLSKSDQKRIIRHPYLFNIYRLSISSRLNVSDLALLQTYINETFFKN